MSERRGTLHQDRAFTIEALASRRSRRGARVEALASRHLRSLRIARVHGSDEVVCLYLEVDRPGVHRIYLDAGLVSHEDWGEIIPDDLDHDGRQAQRPSSARSIDALKRPPR